MVFCSLCLLLLGATSCTKDQDIESTAAPSPSTAVEAQEAEELDVTHIPSSQLRSLRASYSPHQAKGLPLDSQSTHAEALTTLSDQLLKILPSFADPKQGKFAATSSAMTRTVRRFGSKRSQSTTPRRSDYSTSSSLSH